MQQQTTHQEQYGNHHQVGQQMMICPVQYVYEQPMMMTQGSAPEEQIQQNQTVLFNVQNPPPWIQNRPQTQVIYVQQLPNNFQHYVHPHMIQSPLYQPQINYQIQQPMVAHENRQFVQIPNVAAYNTVQSQPAQPQQQQISYEEAEKMPLLTQMLNQKTNLVNVNNSSNVRAANAYVRPATPVNNVNMQRPVTQNQQVQTNISANNKGRPRNGAPQIITINPMQQQQRQYVSTTEKSEVLINLSRPIAPYIRPDVPQHIRSKIPSSISVKSINKPLQLRPVMRQFDVMPSPQNFVYNPNYVAVSNPETRNIMTNTDRSYFKQNNQDRNAKVAESALPAAEKMPIAKDQDEAVIGASRKQPVDANTTAKSKFDLVRIYDGKDDKKVTETAVVRNIETQTQTEEKLIRNTVYVQARGRVRNEKLIPQSRSLKRPIEDKPVEEKTAEQSPHQDNHSSNKYSRVEVIADVALQTNKLPINSSVTLPMKIGNHEPTIKNVPIPSNNAQTDVITSKTDNNSMTKPLVINTPEVFNPINEVNTDLDQSNASNNIIIKIIEERTCETKTGLCKVSAPAKNSSDLKGEASLKDFEQNNGKNKNIELLTHVLDGYIIQESNVAFPIYKPIKDTRKKEDNSTESLQESNAKSSENNDGVNQADAPDKTLMSWRFQNTNVNSEKEFESSNTSIDKEDPFANVQKSTVEAWTTEELASHLEKHDWLETAGKLQDEEIDGQSILLVNRDQLVAIGVCERHADVISAFSAS